MQVIGDLPTLAGLLRLYLFYATLSLSLSLSLFLSPFLETLCVWSDVTEKLIVYIYLNMLYNPFSYYTYGV